MSPATASIVAAGRISPKISPWTADRAAASAMSTTNIRVRTTSASVNPPSARARSMIAKTARAWPATSPGCCERPSGPGVGRPGDPARVADDHGPAVARRGLPRPARRDAPPPAGAGLRRRPSPALARHAARSAANRGSSARHAEHLRIARDGQQQPSQHRRPRHDRVHVQVLARGVVVATDRARARRGSARPCRTWCWHRTPHRSPCRRP